MKNITNLALGALMLAGSALVSGQPARADNFSIGFSFGAGDVGNVFGSPCYGRGRCAYPVYYQPVYIDGAWYRGPIYYRVIRGDRYYWYHGDWRRDEWRGPRPRNIQWRDWRGHGRWNDNWRGDRDWHDRRDRHDNRRGDWR